MEKVITFWADFLGNYTIQTVPKCVWMWHCFLKTTSTVLLTYSYQDLTEDWHYGYHQMQNEENHGSTDSIEQ